MKTGRSREITQTQTSCQRWPAKNLIREVFTITFPRRVKRLRLSADELSVTPPKFFAIVHLLVGYGKTGEEERHRGEIGFPASSSVDRQKVKSNHIATL